jgi:hypothetical protein
MIRARTRRGDRSGKGVRLLPDLGLTFTDLGLLWLLWQQQESKIGKPGACRPGRSQLIAPSCVDALVLAATCRVDRELNVYQQNSKIAEVAH